MFKSKHPEPPINSLESKSKCENVADSGDDELNKAQALSELMKQAVVGVLLHQAAVNSLKQTHRENEKLKHFLPRRLTSILADVAVEGSY